MEGYPLRFRPIYKERVWGGRRLADRYGRDLPPERPIGESWELTDRPEGVSVVINGPFAGQSMADLMAGHREALLGDASPHAGRFPLLVKILDARQVLSLQVHPPERCATALGGEPKTELWYFTETDPAAEILVGLRHGTSRSEFERRLADGTVADCFHRIPVGTGDAMFLPSGRVHALGAGLVLFEIQENSDTTYRVHDWNRLGLDGKPRPLHVQESLASIDFSDFEPDCLPRLWEESGATDVRLLVDHPRFRVEARRGAAGAEHSWSLARCVVVGVSRGTLVLAGTGPGETLGAGDFCLLPASMGRAHLRVLTDAEWLIAEPGRREAIG